MQWSARPYDILAPVGSHVQDADFPRASTLTGQSWGTRAYGHAGRPTSRVRAGSEHAASLLQRRPARSEPPDAPGGQRERTVCARVTKTHVPLQLERVARSTSDLCGRMETVREHAPM